MLDEILQERVAPRGHRRNLRGVKRKMSNFPLRRRIDKPLPVNIAKAIRILIPSPDQSEFMMYGNDVMDLTIFGFRSM